MLAVLRFSFRATGSIMVQSITLFEIKFSLTCPEKSVFILLNHNIILHLTQLQWIQIFSMLLALCAGNSPVTGEFPSQRPELGVFMPLPLGPGGIMFSGCPSVRPSVCPKYPLSTCTWVRWSIRPTMTVLWHVRLSVCLEKFPGICQRTHGGNGLKFCMLMYLDHLQNWLVYGYSLLIF